MCVTCTLAYLVPTLPSTYNNNMHDIVLCDNDNVLPTVSGWEWS